jgi:hypothetical protein
MYLFAVFLLITYKEIAMISSQALINASLHNSLLSRLVPAARRSRRQTVKTTACDLLF